MTILKTWFTAYVLHASFYLFTGEIAGAILVAMFSFPASLLGIPVLYLFWTITSDRATDKIWITVSSCLVGAVTAVAASLATIAVIAKSLSGETLASNSLFIVLPVLAAIFSIVFWRSDIYTYAQRHVSPKTETEL
ncbi:MAG: hypothetical protein JNL72_07765 [Flavipsychrobacter sp.]|nr:hypothetical protein [Flavipsychrobacter sp.]